MRALEGVQLLTDAELVDADAFILYADVWCNVRILVI